MAEVCVGSAQNSDQIKLLYHTSEQKDLGLPESSYNASKKLKHYNESYRLAHSLPHEFSLYKDFARDQFTRDTLTEFLKIIHKIKRYREHAK